MLNNHPSKKNTTGPNEIGPVVAIGSVFLFSQDLASLDIRMPRHEALKGLVRWRVSFPWQQAQDHQQIIVGLKVVGLRRLHNRVYNCTGFRALHAVTKQPILSAHNKWPDRILCQIVGNGNFRSIQKRRQLLRLIQLNEYYGAAEPPVRCGESHLSGLTEPPIDSYSA